jgi:hypothetical protein
MESKGPPTPSNGAERTVGGQPYEANGLGKEEGPATPPDTVIKESTAKGEAADVYGNLEDAENLGYVERG